MIIKLKILLLGGLNAIILAKQLRHYGVDVTVAKKRCSFRELRNFDIVYAIGISELRQLVLLRVFSTKLVLHVVGSDAKKMSRWMKRALVLANEILYVSREIKEEIGLNKGEIIPIPIDTKKFVPRFSSSKRDVLYYCPNEKIYRLNWILRYAKNHLDETITVIVDKRNFRHGLSDPRYPNVLFTPAIDYENMVNCYNQHRKLIRMTIYDGYPKMPYEALLCELEVIWNGKHITKVPSEMRMENTIPKLISILRKLIP